MRVNEPESVPRMMFARFRAAHHKLASEEFLVVQLRYRAFRFFDREHLHEGETFRALVVPVADHFRVLHLANAVEELEQIALSRIEGEIADVKTRRCDFDCFRLALGTDGRSIARRTCGGRFDGSVAVSEQSRKSLP